MKFMQTEKKQLLIYVIIAYGITYVMGLLMWTCRSVRRRRTGFRKALRFCHQPKKCDVCGRGGTNSESHRNSAGKIRRNAGAGSDFPGRF